MRRAIDETDRRRTLQMAHNKAHNIAPRSIQKAITDIMEGARSSGSSSAKQYARVAEEIIEYASLTPAQLEKKIASLEKQMYEHARNLEFEEAGNLRDKIRHIQAGNLGLVE